MRDIIADLLDDHNIVLYALILLALLDNSQIEMIAGGMLGYWTGKTK